MPIVFRHDAAGIPLGKGDDARSKYGMAMVGQQQKYDAEMRQGQQDAMYGMQRLEAMRGMQSAREPSLGEESAMMDNEIRSGLYDPDTVRALRDNERAIKLILRDRNLNATQQSEAIGNIRSQMRMMRSTGRVQPMMQAMPQGQGGQMPQPPSARQVFRQDPKTMERFMGIVQQQQLASEGPAMSYEDQVRKALELYETQQRLLSDPQPGQQAPPAAQPQGAPQSVGSASVSGGSVFGVDPVLASPMPGGAQPQVGSQSAGAANVVMGGLPGAVSAPLQPSAPPRRGRPALIMPGQGIAADGIPQPGLQDLQALNARLRNESATQQQPQEPVYGGPPAQPAVPQQQPPIYPMQAISGMQAQGQPLPMQGGGGVRNWTSADGKYSTQGELQSVLNQPGGEPVAVIKKSNGSVVNVPMSKLSVDDVDFALSGGNVQPVRPDTSNRDTMYDLQNRGRTPGTNFMDPNNPVRQEMSAADQSIVNPQRQTLGKPGGRYGLGQVDYGINPATGNRVTASIRPGGTAVEYDEPVSNVGKVGGGPAGQRRVVNTLGRKRPSVSPGEATPSEQAAYNALPSAPAGRNSNDPKIQEALAIARNPDSVTADRRQAAAVTLRNAGYTTEDVASAIGNRQQSKLNPVPTASSYDDLNSAYEVMRSAKTKGTPTKSIAEANAVMKRYGWTDEEIKDLYRGSSKKKLSPPVVTQENVKEMLDYLETGRASDAERSIIEDVLKSKGVDFSKKPALTPQGEARPATSATVAKPPAELGQKYSPSTPPSSKTKPSAGSVQKYSSETSSEAKPRWWDTYKAKTPETEDFLKSIEKFASNEFPEEIDNIMNAFNPSLNLEEKARIAGDLYRRKGINLDEIKKKIQGAILKSRNTLPALKEKPKRSKSGGSGVDT